MPKVRDQATIHWRDSSHSFAEELVLYESTISETSSTKTIESGVVPDVILESEFDQIRLRGFMTSLYVCLEEMGILKNMSRRVPDKHWGDLYVYRTLAERFDIGGEMYDLVELNDERKSLRDTMAIYNILIGTYDEMALANTCSVLKTCTAGMLKEGKDRLELLKELKTNSRLYMSVRYQLAQLKRKNNRLRAEISQQVNKVNLEYKDMIGYAQAEFNYNNAWEDSRYDQKIFLITKEMQQSEDIIEFTRRTITHENTVHDSVVEYLEEYVNDLTSQIDYWNRRYDQELEQTESDLIKVRADIEQIALEKELLKSVYEIRLEDMDEWLFRRGELRIASDAFKKLLAAAVKIQAWWRGMMYRNKLGPYRKKKKRKSKGKDNKPASPTRNK